jgi:hypothetical protein
MRDCLSKLRASLLALACLAIVAWPASGGVLRRVTIRGIGQDLGETPLTVEVPSSVVPNVYLLTPKAGGAEIFAYVYSIEGKSFLSLVVDQLKASANDSYSARIANIPDSLPAGVDLERDGATTHVLIAGQIFIDYLIDPSSKPYLFPVIGPTGVPYTRAYPMKTIEGEDNDHPHQRSFWFTHGKVNGVDFWSETPGHGLIRERSRENVPAQRNAAVIRALDEWVGPDGKKVCDDERILRFYATKSIRVIDFDITIRATVGPVTFGDTKEGMFGLRVASSMDVKRKKGGKITNAEGITDDAAWGKASPWVDYTGPVEGETVGIAILNHPESFRHPTTWHVRDYGLFAANPFGWHDFGRPESGDYTIPAGKSISFRYRVIFHKGDTASAQVPAAYRAYSKPPEVEVQAH